MIRFRRKTIRNVFYIQFKPFTNIQEEKGKIEQAFGISQEQIQDNVYLLAAMGGRARGFLLPGHVWYSRYPFSFFVLIAAVLMISSSFQTSVSERIRFFRHAALPGSFRKQDQKVCD